MFKKGGILFLYAETPIHAGSGTSVTGVDLPIQREKHTQYPMLQSPGLKGATRDIAPIDDKEIEVLFGPDTERASEHAGCLAFTDARILLFPVRSLAGVFAWVTCPAVLERFRRDLELVCKDKEAVHPFLNITIPKPGKNEAYVPKGTNLAAAERRIILEDFDLKMKPDGNVDAIAKRLSEHAFPQTPNYWAEKVKKDLVILNDDDFSHFVQFATEVITRIRLGETGTVEEGPWDEEYLPSESLLYSLVLATDPRVNWEKLEPNKEKRQELQNKLKDAAAVLKYAKDEIFNKTPHMQLGGNETVGRGILHIRFHRAKDFVKKEECHGEERTETDRAEAGGAGL
jgi:CRISPR-associated protein Cmr4